MTFSLALTVLFCAASVGTAAWLCVRTLRAGERGGQIGTLLWGALMGAGLFFALESGICRRIGFDLFLPAAGGTPLPWRALRMGLCLALCLAAATDGRLVPMRARLRTLLDRDRGCWLAGALTTALFFLWAWRVTVFCFMTNDDTTLMKAIGDSSFWGLTNAYSHPYLCAALHWLYGLAPGVSWYAGLHLAIHAAAMTVIGRCIHLKMRGRNWPLGAGFALHGMLCAGLFLYMLSELSYTVTPAAAGAAAVALILCRDDTDRPAGRVLTDIASVLLMALCRLQRAPTAQAVLCFWVLAVVYQLARLLFVRPRPGRVRRAARFSVSVVLTGAVLLAVEYAPLPDGGQRVWNEQTGYSYSLAEYYRSTVMDYYLDKLSDEQVAAVGIPLEFVPLLRDWCFLDESITTDTFRAIVETYPDAISGAASADAGGSSGGGQAPAESGTEAGTAVDGGQQSPPSQPESAPAMGLFARLRSMLSAATASMTAGRARTAKLLAGCVGLLLALLVLRLIRCGRDGWLETLCGLLAAGGGALMVLYLIREGRLLLRVFLVPIVPAATVMALMALQPPEKPADRLFSRGASLLSGLVTAALCLLCLVTARSVPYAGQSVSRQDVFEGQILAESIAEAYPDTTFITNALSNDVDPFHDPGDYPANLIRWGDPGVTASADRLYAGAFLRDDVQFIYEKPSTIVAVLQYLTVKYGPVQARLAATLTNTLFLADISRIAPAEPNYTGWYEQNGLTYYFRDGQALAGQQDIDGQSYTFAPAGAACQFAAAPGAEGAIYYTDAYSLVQPEAEP